MSGRAIFPGPADAPPSLDVMETAPELPRYAREDVDVILAGRQPAFSEFMGASVREGWFNTTLGTGGALARVERATEENPEPLPRHEWEASQYWRQGVPWDERMTVGRARALAQVFDENRYRRQVMAARDPGLLEAALGFGGQIVGAIPDPVNFLPIAGPVTRGARAVGATRVAAALEAPGLAGGAARGAVEGFGGNLAVAPFIYGGQAILGEEVTFGRVVTDLAVGAVIGAGFGTLGAALSRAGAAPDPVVSARTLDLAARDVAAGRPIEIPASLVLRQWQETLTKAAPPEVEFMIAPLRAALADGNNVVPVPARPDGSALSRAEFDNLFNAEWARSVRPDEANILTLAAQARALQDVLDQLPGGSSIAPKIAAEIDAIMRAVPDIQNVSLAVARLQPEAQIVAATQARASALQRVLDATDRADADAGRIIAAEADRAIARAESARSEAYEWYQAAHELNRRAGAMTFQAPRVSDASPLRQERETPQQMPPDGRSTQQQAPAAVDADDAASRAQIEALRAEGRLTDADMAALRAADEAAAEMDAVANGLEQAGACLLRNLA